MKNPHKNLAIYSLIIIFLSLLYLFMKIEFPRNFYVEVLFFYTIPYYILWIIFIVSILADSIEKRKVK